MKEMIEILEMEHGMDNVWMFTIKPIHESGMRNLSTLDQWSAFRIFMERRGIHGTVFDVNIRQTIDEPVATSEVIIVYEFNDSQDATMLKLELG